MSQNGIAIVDGQPINVATLDEAVAGCIDRARRGEGFTFFTLNLDHLVKRRADPAFRDAYRRATFVSADGAPIVALARRRGARLARTTGADLVLPLCEAAAKSGTPVFLFGSDDDSLSAARRSLLARFPALDIRGALAPPQGFDPSSPLADIAGRQIAASGARLCFLALGAPKQELFADRMAKDHPQIGFLCIGAALDFISGSQIRAPALFQNNGLEWLWRLAVNPRRLALRYARCAAVLADIVVLDPLRRGARRGA